MKQIGIHNLLLETDLEDSTTAWDDLNEGMQGIAAALDMDVCEVANETYDNAMRFYFEQEAKTISIQ
jgi:Tat protein secretion system quality control protein TatD with DNase activity